MSRLRRRYSREFREGVVRIIEETDPPAVELARVLGLSVSTLRGWVRIARTESPQMSNADRVELARLRAENIELRTQRDVCNRVLHRWIDALLE